MHVFEKLAEYRYEQLVFCHDKATGLRAVIAIHDTTLGPGPGGCRMYPYDSEDEAVMDALRLARGMTYKAAASGLNLGGGKSVIIGDPEAQVRVALPFLRPLPRDSGRPLHRRRGRRHLDRRHGEHPRRDLLRRGRGRDLRWLGGPSPFTALGVLQGMKACAEEVFGDASLEDRTVAVQGLGHVGWHLCRATPRRRGGSVRHRPARGGRRAARQEFGAKPVELDEILHPLRRLRPLRPRGRRQRRDAAGAPVLHRRRQRQQRPPGAAPRRGARQARHPLRSRLRHKRRRPHQRRRRARGYNESGLPSASCASRTP